MNSNECRGFNQTDFEVRAEEGKRPVIMGYAAVFNKRSNNLGYSGWDFYEIIEPGAFDAVLNDDVRALVDHQSGNMTLARTKPGTLRLNQDDIGLRFEFDVPDTTAGNDIYELVSSGAIDQASFAFRVDPEKQKFEEIEGGGDLRTIQRGGIKNLLDISLVTYPAYEETLVQARNNEPGMTERTLQLERVNKEKRARRFRFLEAQIQG